MTPPKNKKATGKPLKIKGFPKRYKTTKNGLVINGIQEVSGSIPLISTKTS